MKYKYVGIGIQDRVATLRLCDPARRNAMNLTMREEIVDVLKRLEADDGADCVIITGEGDRAFSAGADISELESRSVRSELSYKAQLRRQLPRLVETLRVPTLAVINGYCLGAGLELALACSLRIAGESAKLGLPEIHLGVIPGSGGTQRLARMVGIGRAMELITLGEVISAQRAETIGLVNRIYPDGELMAEARAICGKWQSKGPFSLAAARDAVLRSFDVDLDTGLDFENKLFALCLSSGERDEGVRAFKEKREPRFRD